MPINPNIALGVQPVAIKTPGQARMERLKIENAERGAIMDEQAIAANDIKLQNAEQDIAKGEREANSIRVLSDLMAQHGDNVDAIKEGLNKGGYGDRALKVDEWYRAKQAAGLKAELEELKVAKEKGQFLAQTLQSINSPETFMVGVARAVEKKILPIEKANELLQRGYNEETQAGINQLIAESQSVKEYMDAEEAKRKSAHEALLRPIELKAKQADATIKGQEATGTKPIQPFQQATLSAQEADRTARREDAAAARAVTMRGQNMTDARSRETNSIAGAKLESGAVATIADLENGLKQLTRLKSDIQDGRDSMGVVGALATAPYIGPVLQRAGVNKPAVLKAKIGLARQIIGKALEGGVLRKEDEDKYRALLADIGDQPDTAFQKIDNLTTELESKLKTFKDANIASGRRPMSGAETQIASKKSGRKVGDVVKVGGKNVRITRIDADGTFDGDEVN